jgi:hypothetical protein
VLAGVSSLSTCNFDVSTSLHVLPWPRVARRRRYPGGGAAGGPPPGLPPPPGAPLGSPSALQREEAFDNLVDALPIARCGGAHALSLTRPP